MLKIFATSLGCPKNRVDTERLLGSLGPVRTVDRPGRADLLFINTCGFIQPAVRESVRAILDAINHAKKRGRPPLLVVAGCMVGRYGAEELAGELPEVDLWLSSRDLESWPARLAALWAARSGSPAVAAPAGRLLSGGRSWACLKISEGCRHRCSFCTIPSIRGAYRSTPLADLEREARDILGQGVRELILVAQDVTAWGCDLPGAPTLIRLLERLLPLDGLDRLRLLYLYPSGITPELLHFIKGAGPRMLPYFDVPLQHAHPDILRRMGRPFADDPRRVVDRIRAALPDAALRTSLIAGFPGETEAHFATLRAFVEETRFTHLGVFTYQAEDGTPAAVLPYQVREEVRERRRDELMEIQADISADFLRGLVGGRMEVLVDAPNEQWPGLHTGRVWFQAPEIDGLTYISGPGVVPGALVEADIEDSADYDLTALT